jgi:enediyne biosynthesis protein E4
VICRAFCSLAQHLTNIGGRKISRGSLAWARGANYGDINNDGAPDILVATNGGPAVLFRNTGATNHSLRIKLVGTRSNRDGIGTDVRVTAGTDTQTKALRSGSIYLSSSDLVLTFGLGTHTGAEAIEVRWPSGPVDHLKNVSADQIITVKEKEGIAAAKPLAKR